VHHSLPEAAACDSIMPQTWINARVKSAVPLIDLKPVAP